MAKKKTTTDKAVEQVVEQPVETVVAQSKPKVENKKVEPKWEIKNRTYFLKGKMKPLSRSIKAANIYWFDEKKVTKES